MPWLYSAEIKKTNQGRITPRSSPILGSSALTKQENSPFNMFDKNSRYFQLGGISRCLLIPGASTSVEAHDDDNDNCKDQENDYCDHQTDYESRHALVVLLSCCLVLLSCCLVLFLLSCCLVLFLLSCCLVLFLLSCLVLFCCLVADTSVLERTGVARVHLHISRTHASHNLYLRIMTVYGKKERRLAQCRFPGLAISNAKILIYSSNKIYGCNFIKQHSQTDCSLKTNFIVSLIIIFGTLSFVFKSVLGRPGEQSPNNL